MGGMFGRIAMTLVAMTLALAAAILAGPARAQTNNLCANAQLACVNRCTSYADGCIQACNARAQACFADGGAGAASALGGVLPGGVNPFGGGTANAAAGVAGALGVFGGGGRSQTPPAPVPANPFSAPVAPPAQASHAPTGAEAMACIVYAQTAEGGLAWRNSCPYRVNIQWRTDNPGDACYSADTGFACAQMVAAAAESTLNAIGGNYAMGACVYPRIPRANPDGGVSCR